MKALPTLDRIVTFTERLLVHVSAAGIAAVMLIVVLDVGGRYLLNAPLLWSYDLISIYLFPAIFFLALSDTFRRNHHLAVDILYLRMSELTQRSLRLFGALVGAAVMAPVAWLAAGQTAERYAENSVIAGTILWPTWIASMVAALGVGLLVLRLALDAAALAAAIGRRSRDVPGESSERAALEPRHIEEAI